MYFPDKRKALGSILDGFDKYKKEKSDKMEFSEIEPSKMAKGGEAEDQDHMEALASHSEEMHDAHKVGDFMRHAHAMKAFMHEHEAHEAKKKDVDNGPVSDKKDSKKVAISGDEYD